MICLRYTNISDLSRQNYERQIIYNEAVDLGGLKVRLVFSDGTDSTVDVGDYIRRHPHPL